MGALAAFAFVPFGVTPVLWLSFPALFLLLQGTRRDREAFAVGWSFAFGLLVISLYWIAGALFVDIKSFWWVLPLALAGLPALFAIYYGLAAMLARRWGLARGVDVFFFAFCWFLADMARAHLLTGFPWDIMGYVWADTLPVLQSVSVIGIDGLTLVTLILATLPALFFVLPSRKAAWLACGLGLVVLAGMSGAGQLRLSRAGHGVEPTVRLRLVQPHLAQAMKWEPERRLANFQNLMRLSFETKGEKPVTHILWPETATAYYLTEETAIRQRIAQAMPKGSVLITGVVRRAPNNEAKTLRYYNALVAMDDKGTLIAGYDKFHLVPFGEYMPLRSVIPFRVITALGTDFTAGEGARTLRVPNLPPFSPLICYEAIFSGEVAEKEDPPRFLLNATNDAWYDGTIGPAQHFMIARVRAVEEGIPLVRVANGGETGVVDSYGRITALIGADQEGVLDADLPVAAEQRTLFSKRGDYLPFFLTLILLTLLNLIKTCASAGRKQNNRA
ncbi:MAG: apolipoprotein N-acyltransferase [Bdellovibrionales bacterium]